MTWMTKIAALVLAGVMFTQPVAASALTYGYSYNPYNYSTTAPRTATTTSTSTASTLNASVEKTLLSLLNAERTKRGLSPLQSDSSLTNLARLKSSDMVAKNYFSHTSPTYGTPAQMLSRYGISYRLYAENIAQGADAYRIHAMWLASAGHRANILNPQLNRVGIGVTRSSTGSYTATLLFIAR
jgi:uncharacterized YkwD family protein